MAELTTGESKSASTKKRELSMEMRMLIAFILMGAVLFVTPYFYKSQAPPAKPVAEQTTKQAAEAESAASRVAERPGTTAAPTADPPPPVAGQAEEVFTVENGLYRVEFSNRGAVVRQWTLKKYSDSTGKPLDLVNAKAAGKVSYPFHFVFQDKKPSVDLNQVLYQAHPSADGLGVDYEYSDGKTWARKSFRFTKGSYLGEISSEVTEGGTSIPHLLGWRGGFGDLAVTNAASLGHSLYYDPAEASLAVLDASEAKEAPVSHSGAYSFAGIEDTYFMAVFLPKSNGSVETRTFSDTVATPHVASEEPHVGVAVGGDARNEFSLFVGPKDIQILRTVNPKLEQAVDFGFFSIIAKPLFLAVHWVNDSFVHNYGWAIVLVTILINFALFPLKITSMKSMKKMQALQPQIAAINERYKNIGMRDPRKQEQNQEVMALYKRYGVNPMGGCVPILLQIPFFFAFYTVLTVSIEMRQAGWLWVSDLSGPDPFYLLPIAMIATQFLMQRMTPSAGMDKNQQKMMMFMPLVIGFMFLSAASGLVLYWFTGNVVGIAQQWFFNRTSIAAAAAEAVQPKRKNNRK
ncbi:MAG: membrane protein insertase YidC [Bryobacteraceae bacterium]